jgi:ATP-dependent Clp protease ATP-binding subunit ClpA
MADRIPLSDGTKVVVDRAAKAAGALGSSSSSVGHVWLGLCQACELAWEQDLGGQTPETVVKLLRIGAEMREAREALTTAGIAPHQCLAWLQNVLPVAGPPLREQHVGRDLTAQSVFTEATRFCREHGRPVLRPVHLLLDLAHSREEPGGRLLDGLQADRHALYQAAAALGRRPWPGEAETAPAPAATPTLSDLAPDLSASPGLPVVGRAPEITELSARLAKPGLVLLVGRPGVGRHAIVRGVAGRIHDGAAHATLATSSVYYLPVERLLALATEAVAAIINEAEAAGAILALGPLEPLFEASHAERAAPIIQALRARRVRAVGVMDPERLAVFPSAELPWFDVIYIMEPTPDETVPMLQAEAHRLEAQSGVRIDPPMLELTAQRCPSDRAAGPRPASAFALLRRAVAGAQASSAPVLLASHLEAALTPAPE